jgi:flagellar hook protein FlgE
VARAGRALKDTKPAKTAQATRQLLPSGQQISPGGAASERAESLFCKAFSVGMEVAGKPSGKIPARLCDGKEGSVMGIFGAMTTAVSGLRSQAYALENISGNIANSQTTGFKRVETSFVDLIPELPYRRELAGSVSTYSRLTNTIQGDLQSTGVSTHMAINGEGFFIVQERTGYNNNRPTFGGIDLYTRRGDFTVDRDGYLVNGAGFYLRGSSIDPITGELRGGGSGIIQISSDPLPARPTTQIEYTANLPSAPGTAAREAANGALLSDLLGPPPAAPSAPNPAFPAAYDPRILTGSASPGPAVVGSDSSRFMSQSIEGGLVPAYNAVGARIDVQLRWAKVAATNMPATATGTADIRGAYTLGAGNDGNLTINGTPIALVAADDATSILSKINAESTTTGVTARIDTSGQLVLTSEDTTSDVVVAGTGVTLTSLGITAGTNNPVTGQDTWNLFYAEDLSATGNQPAWRNVGVPFTFNSSGVMTNPASGVVNVSNLTVAGNTIGNVRLNFLGGSSGLTQYASADGRVGQATLQQDGYSAGTLDSISVTGDGRISGSYSNGRVVPVAQISVAQFNADNALKRRDGGTYEQTLESGLPMIGLGGATLIGGNVEGSNTDIAEEFSKMIVTQQAYSANTRVVTTSQQMLSDVLNMVR